MRYILITGSRTWTDYATIEKELDKLSVDDVTLVHGGAKGADSIADFIWKKKGGNTVVCVPDWNKFGKAAGPLRNEQMLLDHKISSALAFCNKGSKGTMHMVSLLNKKKIPVSLELVM